MKLKLPFRLGTTSYIIPDEILPNVQYLADKVDDIELILFEVDDGPNNLPDATIIQKLQSLAATYNLTYTVHLPLDLRLIGEDGKRHISLEKARRVIESTKSLYPWAYVLHLDAKEEIASENIGNKIQWVNQAKEALAILAEWTEDESLLAIENLENYPINFWDDVFENNSVSRCIDIGHLWKNHHDPIPYLHNHLSRTRVIHIHGIAERDHKSLSNVSRKELLRVFDMINHCGYKGVITVEVFNQDDFQTSFEEIHTVLVHKNEATWKKINTHSWRSEKRKIKFRTIHDRK